jgi:hypothetical protein|tara:strand:- start:431 stop:1099 length:669 start_codon:yes stop_codon:yes gene_type:complete
MAKRGRGRPKGSLNKKTLEKLDQSSNGIKEEDISLGETQKTVLKGPDMEEAHDIIDEVIKKESKPKRTVKDLPRNPSVVEILGLVEETSGKQAKVDILKQFIERQDVKYALKAAFDSRVQFTLPDGLPDGFVVGDADTPEGAMDMAPERFIRVYKRMQYWVKGGSANSTSKAAKQEEIYLNTLRSLEKSEAEFLVAIKDKTMPFKSVTKEICELAGFDLSPK